MAYGSSSLLSITVTLGERASLLVGGGGGCWWWWSLCFVPVPVEETKPGGGETPGNVSHTARGHRWNWNLGLVFCFAFCIRFIVSKKIIHTVVTYRDKYR